MVDPVLEVSRLTVNYGTARGISDVSLTMEAGTVLGLLGPNGAGKTTLIRAIMDFLHPTSGTVHIQGTSSRDPSSRTSVAYLPGDLVLPARLTGAQCLRRFMGPSWERSGVPESAQSLAQALDIDLSRPAGDLSKGNRQKIGLILAFAPKASLVVLDEPTSGLDPVLQGVFADLVSSARESGAALVLSSHVLSELEDLAQSVAVLRQGELVAHETIEQLRERAHQGLRVQILDQEQLHACAQAAQSSGMDVKIHGSWLEVRARGSIDPLIKIIAKFPINGLEPLGSDLREVFMDFYSSESDTVKR